jgi:hypothetical protein
MALKPETGIPIDDNWEDILADFVDFTLRYLKNKYLVVVWMYLFTCHQNGRKEVSLSDIAEKCGDCKMKVVDKAIKTLEGMGLLMTNRIGSVIDNYHLYPTKPRVESEIPEKGKVRECPVDARNRKIQSGWVYLFRAENGLVKIGKTVNHPCYRLKAINAASPIQSVLIHKIKTNHITWLESKLHRRYADKRVRGEWFALEDKNIRYLSRFDNLDAKV